MKHTRNIITILITFALLLLLSACSSKPLVSQQTMEVQAKQEVVIKAKEGGDSYKWKQLSGVSVVLIDSDKQTLKFKAPEVEREARLVFEVEVKFEDTIEKAQVTVVVSPFEDNADDNTTDGGNDNTNSSSGAGSDDNATDGNNDENTSPGGDGDDTTTPQTVILTSLKLTINKTSLNKDENSTVKVIAAYSDNTSKDVIDNVEWVVTPSDAVKVTNTTLTALQDTPAILSATIDGISSNAVHLDITWTVNGHTLPPEPDPTVNNSTLLGIDSNDNGVRDDVERAIYKKFPKEIRRQQLMQRAKSDQSMMADEEAIKNAQKWQKIIANKNIACASYLFDKFDIDFNLEADDYMDNIQYNTKDRVFKYMRYNHALGGGVYFTPESIVNESSCEFNVTEALKAQ